MTALNIYLQSFGWYKIYFCLFLDIEYFVQFHLKFNYISHDDEDRWMGGKSISETLSGFLCGSEPQKKNSCKYFSETDIFGYFGSLD